jgi:hypothetical protein
MRTHVSQRHCEEQSDDAIQFSFFRKASWIASSQLLLAMTVVAGVFPLAPYPLCGIVRFTFRDGILAACIALDWDKGWRLRRP